MKIAIVLSQPPGYSETFFNNKIQYLLKSGISVEIYTDQYDKNFTLCPQFSLPTSTTFNVFKFFGTSIFKNPVRVFRHFFSELQSGNSFISSFKNTYSCLHLINSEQVNWVHFGFATLAVGRENIGTTIGARLAVSIRGYDISRYPLKHPGVYQKLWTKIDKVHTISDALANKAIKLGLPQNIPIVKITPAINIAAFTNKNIKKIYSTPLQLVTVARLHWSKGLEYTVEALSLIHKAGIDFTYTILGEGKEIERIVLAAHQFGISDKIKFAGLVSHIEVDSFLKDADLYIQYSVQEGFSNSVLEAQAMGIICVVSDAEGLPENVLDEQSGFVVARRNPELLAKKIISLVNAEPSKLNQIRLQAVNRVREFFNIEKQTREFIDFYSK